MKVTANIDIYTIGGEETPRTDRPTLQITGIGQYSLRVLISTADIAYEVDASELIEAVQRVSSR